MRMSIPVMAALLASACVGPVRAQRSYPTADLIGTVGVMGMLIPAYEGAAQHRLLPLPLVQLSYRNRFYLGPNGLGPGGVLGAALTRSAGRSLALEMAFGDGRPSSRSDALAGMSDRDVVGSVGVKADYHLRGIDAVFTVRQGLNGDAGALLGARLGTSRRFGPLFLRTDVTATFADGRELTRSFGVTRDEAARRQSLISSGDDRLRPDDGLAFRPSGGLKYAGVTGFVAYAVTRRWSVVGLGTVTRLSDEVARSSLVRRRTQSSVGIGMGRQVEWGSHDANR